MPARRRALIARYSFCTYLCCCPILNPNNQQSEYTDSRRTDEGRPVIPDPETQSAVDKGQANARQTRVTRSPTTKAAKIMWTFRRRCAAAIAAAASASGPTRHRLHSSLVQPASAPAVKLLIDGKFVDSSTTKHVDVHDPATQNVVCRVPLVHPHASLHRV